jgi:predicted Rossmann fold flavoprotein
MSKRGGHGDRCPSGARDASAKSEVDVCDEPIPKTCDVVVIGGGASGLVAALAAAREGASVVVLEARDRVGKKLLRTGDGRCNLSNVHVGPWAYNAPEFVSPVLEAWPHETVLSFFSDLGLLTFEDARGRTFPRSNSATSVLDVLRLACDHAGVRTFCRREVVAIDTMPTAGQVDAPSFAVHTLGHERILAYALVLSTGDQSDLAASLGLRRTKRHAVLCPLRCERDAIKGLEGIRVEGRLALLRDGSELDAENGEVLFKKDGVSGIPTLDFSRIAQQGDTLELDLFPDIDEARLVGLLSSRAERLWWRTPENFLAGMLHTRLAAAVRRAALRLDSSFSGAAVDASSDVLGGVTPDALAHVMKHFELVVVGLGNPKAAQVTSGGLHLDAFDPQTLEARHVPGLHATGEVLDVDGRCGGYNLHWAWASGLVAGRHAAQCRPSHRIVT